LQRTGKTLPTKLAGPTDSVRGLHGARGPVVGPYWYSLFLFLDKSLSFELQTNM